MMLGACAGALSQVLVYPLDSMKVRMATSPTPMSFAEAFRSTYPFVWVCVLSRLWLCVSYSYGGVKGFYNGIKPCVIGVIPYAGIDLAVYETLKSLYTDYTMQSLTLNPKKEYVSQCVILVLICSTAQCLTACQLSYLWCVVLFQVLLPSFFHTHLH